MLRAVMTIVDGPYQGRRMLVRPGSALLIGRTERAEWVIPHDLQMSGLHLSVEFLGDSLVVRDLGSTNGTWLASRRVTEEELKDGDVLQAGATKFAVHLEQSRNVPEAAQLLADRQRNEVDAPETADAPASTPTPIPPTRSVNLFELDSPHKQDERFAGKEIAEAAAPQGPTSRADAQAERIAGTMTVEIRSEGHAGEVIWLRPGQSVSIGDSPQVDRSFSGVEGLAERHFALDYLNENLHLVDLSSGQATYVNDQLAAIVKLNDGDVIRAGTLELVVRDTNGSANVSANASIGVDRQHGSVPDRTPSPLPRDMAALQRHAILNDVDPNVRREALEAAAWSGERWVVDLGREMARTPDPQWNDVYYIYAVLSPPEELGQIIRLVKCESLGVDRIRLATGFAHPSLVPELLRLMASADSDEAMMAATAFERMLGIETTTAEIAVRATLPADGAVATESETGEESSEIVAMPDVASAAARWHSVQARYESAMRVYGGVIVNDQWDEIQANGFNLEIRWELLLRAHFHGLWRGTPAILQRLTRP